MAQAEHITTAIRELMSRGRPPKSTNPVRAAHTEFVAALAGNAPHPDRFDTDCEALANLCLAVLGGLHLRVFDGASMVLLFRSIEIFVDALGFAQGRRASSTRLRIPTKSRDEKR